MRCWRNKCRGGLRNTTAAGLVPLLLLASVPACGGWSVDPIPTWSKVQGVSQTPRLKYNSIKINLPKEDGRSRAVSYRLLTSPLHWNPPSAPTRNENPHISEVGCAKGADPSLDLGAMARMGCFGGYLWGLAHGS